MLEYSGIFGCSMCGMAFLPKEFACADERRGMLKLPSHHISPLVGQKGQIAMGSDPFRETGVHDSFRGWSNGNWLRHLTLSTFGNPGDFRCESCNMVLLFVKSGLCHKHGEIDVLYSMSLKFGVGELLDLLPDVVRGWAQNIAARDVVVFDQFRFGNYLGVPLAEVLLFCVGDTTLIGISVRFF